MMKMDDSRELQKRKEPRQARHNEVLLTISDVALWLAVKPSTLYAWVAQRIIPALKLQGVIRFRRAAIEAWLEGCATGQPERAQPKQQSERRSSDVDAMIAAAKTDIYTCLHGKPDQDRATGKGEKD